MIWTPAQTGAFRDHAQHDRLYALYHLIAHVGLRRGEACGLPWVDTHLDAGSIEVLNQIVQYGWETAHTSPKTDASAATVSLDEGTVWVLGEQWVRQAKERAAAGADWIDSGLVFTRINGSPLHPVDVTERFHLLVAQRGCRRFGCMTWVTWRRGWR